MVIVVYSVRGDITVISVNRFECGKTLSEKKCKILRNISKYGKGKYVRYISNTFSMVIEN